MLIAGFANFAESGDCVCNDHRVGVVDEGAQSVEEAAFFDELGIDVVQLGDAYSSGFAYIGVFVLRVCRQQSGRIGILSGWRVEGSGKNCVRNGP